MIYHLFSSTLVFVWVALWIPLSHADRAVSSDSEAPKETIWLEEKISPSARFIEDLVKPFTVWIERKINVPREDGDVKKFNELNATISQNDNRTQSFPVISEQRAIASAEEIMPGDVLHIKFIAEAHKYRVKLISNHGQIHILYIDANSGSLILPEEQRKRIK